MSGQGVCRGWRVSRVAGFVSERVAGCLRLIHSDGLASPSSERGYIHPKEILRSTTEETRSCYHHSAKSRDVVILLIT